MKNTLLILGGLVAAALLAAAIGNAPAGAGLTGRTATVATASSSVGRILVDGQGRTLYLFEKDKRGRSSCSGICASYWPPLLSHGKPAAARGAKNSLLGVTRRADGTTQVTYAGHPLYRFRQDTQPGQTGGQGLLIYGAEWYVLSAAGKTVERDGS